MISEKMDLLVNTWRVSLGMRKLELNKVLEIQSLLKDKFKIYFEQIILK